MNRAVTFANALDPFDRANFWLSLAEWRAHHHSKEKAEAALKSTRDALSLVKLEDGQIVPLLERTAIVEAECGEWLASKETFEEADAIMRRGGKKGANRKRYSLEIARLQALKGDRASAEKTLEQFAKEPGRTIDVGVVAVQIALRDFGTAYKTLHGVANIDLRANSLNVLAEAQAKSGDISGAYAWASKETEPLAKALALLGVAQGIPLRSVPGSKEAIEKDAREKPGDGEFKVIHLKKASAVAAAQTLDEWFNGKQPAADTKPRIRIVADPETNSLLIRASQLDIITIQKLLTDVIDLIDVGLQENQAIDLINAGHTAMELVKTTKDPDAKWMAIRILGSLRYEPAVPLLLASLADEQPNVRANAARALGDMKVAAAAKPLTALLAKEENGGVIQQTSLAMLRLHCTEAVPALKAAAKHDDVQTRMWVLQAIGGLGGKREVPFLARYLVDDPEQAVQAKAAEAIGQITGADFGFPKKSGPSSPVEGLERALKWWEEHKNEYLEK